ncbi:MAG: glycosyltransferase family 4 protein [Solirubrobacterales bacterium]|nr:glycosyltransferase family 4 protein [Solirubrobacterales bacterium]MBV9597039.1 glycosyltransferase family 4 protein [Chloroflexota bacterium]
MYSDRMFARPWSSPIVARTVGHVERRSDAYYGLGNAIANRKLIRSADITLGIFEDNGSFAAAVQTTPLRAVFPSKVALLVCWLAERAQHASHRKLERYRRVIAGADKVFYFSPNQTEIFEQCLRADRAKLHPVDFGIDGDFFAPVGVASDGGYVVAVGRDRSRDHELLVEAVRGTGISTRIYSPRLAVDRIPPNVTWIPQRVSHLHYRHALANSRLVVVPTRSLAYPAGQTVILEGMASRKVVIATDSTAIRHYVRDGVTGVLTPPGDREALRQAIRDLVEDSERRERIAAAGLASIRARFNQRTMWATIGLHLRSLSPSS